MISPTPDFSLRSKRTEIMDNLMGTGPDWHQALRELKVINKLLGGNNLTIKGIRKLLTRNSIQGALSIADMGCGGGDMLMVIARWGRRNRIPLRLLGIDANPNILEYARKNTAAYPEIEYLQADIFSDDFKKRKFDIVTCTLFTHHFRSHQLSELLSHLKKQVNLGLVINDLHRHPLAFYSIKAITAIASRSRMVKHDAPVSVLRAFSRKDWEQILKKAGVQNYLIAWQWAFRWMVLVRPAPASS